MIEIFDSDSAEGTPPPLNPPMPSLKEIQSKTKSDIYDIIIRLILKIGGRRRMQGWKMLVVKE